jgi:hypothetical protein
MWKLVFKMIMFAFDCLKLAALLQLIIALIIVLRDVCLFRSYMSHIYFYFRIEFRV